MALGGQENVRFHLAATSNDGTHSSLQRQGQEFAFRQPFTGCASHISEGNTLGGNNIFYIIGVIVVIIVVLKVLGLY